MIFKKKKASESRSVTQYMKLTDNKELKMKLKIEYVKIEPFFFWKKREI